MPRLLIPRISCLVLLCFGVLAITSCHRQRSDRGTVVFLIESSPTSLDPRVGTDAQSEHIDELLFDGLVERDASFRVKPGLADSWEQPDPLTVIFHLHPNVHFSDGRPLTSRDVLWTIRSMRDGTVITAKGASYASVASMAAPDPLTVVLHLKEPDNFLLTNLSAGAMGIVPYGSGRDFWRHPIGSGPFRFVSQEIDKEVIVERNPQSWNTEGNGNIERVRFAVVPEPVTRALELRKGSADLESNSLTPDMLPELAREKDLAIDSKAGTQVQYLAFNTVDPVLRDARVRQAIACAIDIPLILKTLQAGRAQPTVSLLPATHWAWTGDVDRYDFDPSRAERLLEEAGYPRKAGGVRLHLTLKTSTDEGTRQLAATLQQQLAAVGIDLDIRSYEAATYIQDLNRGSFQIYALRWVGGNEQPDIFAYAFSSARIPPKGANRGRYRNPELDALLADASSSTDQERRRKDYVQVQQILARDLPAFNLWYKDSIVVHNRRISGISVSPSGSFDFLRSAHVQM
ncbi:ABC transporter substrate-binding protein [Acidicapsa dinghuensis]|uniref:ABC transporter substrate-binding protein n=1 Tax=Acidicapsa dinghuensis TaxID=2218256 RepID=A0ABW1ELK5_9BACT|nr:ABC transporter substrate-binding protein [Acidicapsa dinghuensis]